jgi:inosine/xanthosine triphosphate pyrophosphatase family protein
MKGNFIHIVHTNIVIDCESCDHEMKAFQDEEDAQKYFNEIVAKEKKEVKYKEDWVIDEDSSTSFEAYEDGYYSENHSVVSLKTINIQ